MVNGIIRRIRRNGAINYHLTPLLPDVNRRGCPNGLAQTVLCAKADRGAVKECFLTSPLLTDHQVYYHHQGDFLVDEKIVLEVGGRSKDAAQITGLKDAYLAIDDIESGYDNVIPLWLFGFLY